MAPPLSAYEPEMGQTDGTMAHGLERTLCLDLQNRGWFLRSWRVMRGSARIRLSAVEFNEEKKR